MDNQGELLSTPSKFDFYKSQHEDKIYTPVLKNRSSSKKTRVTPHKQWFKIRN